MATDYSAQNKWILTGHDQDTPVPKIEYCANQDAYKVYAPDGSYEYVPASEINVLFNPAHKPR